MDKSTGLTAAEETSRVTLIAEVENRLHLNIFISIFFCTLLYTFMRSMNMSETDANKALLTWAMVPTSYLLSYVFFEFGRSLIREWWLRCISILLLAGTVLFVLPMALISVAEAKWYAIDLWLGALSFRGIPIIPIALLVPIVLGIVWGVPAWWREERAAGHQTKDTG